MNTLDNNPNQGWLSWFLKGSLVLIAVILFARLAELQIIKGDYFNNLAQNNRIRHVSIIAPRGKILGSDNEIIAGNIPIKEKIVFTKDGFEKSLDTDGVNPNDLITESKRNYFLGSAAAHITGYLAEVNEDEVDKVDPKCPEKGPRGPGDFVGRSGLEERYDCLLRGVDGEELIEVDAMGQPVRVLGTKNPIPGKDLTTTINTALQQKVASVMENPKLIPPGTKLPDGKRGATVITDGKGRVLAMYSSPSYDPNIFINKNSKEINNALKNQYLPLFDRTIDGLYHPGSTFKIVTSTAALEEGKIDENFTFKDEGFITLNGYTYGNWFWSEFGRTEGEINLTKAIARSTDTFFYKVGEIVGINDLSSWAKKFGLDRATGIDIPNEASGLIPDPAWKRQAKGELWFLGDTYNVSIGQGDVAITPLAANILTSSIASGGKICPPHINSEIENQCLSLALHQKTIDLIKEGMIGACSDGGTAFPFFGFTPQVACKTGTAETGDNGKTHAWFAAFAPATDPKIVIDVIVEKAGQGSEVAAPIAKEILQYYFQRK
ncbi:MAG TPA: penicillin-binding transpeptidase domain-containing protein [Candidatus Saccharimonadales bacterium]|nr:penicillin-binding transpeptidase domain-containing protein [Candidatus Saccharimonadales bacterium]